jgi:hypothetical protein
LIAADLPIAKSCTMKANLSEKLLHDHGHHACRLD